MNLEIESKCGVVSLDGYSLFAESGNSYDASAASLKDFTPQQIAQLVHELSALAWISVEDELPEHIGWYQVKGINDVASYFHGKKFTKGVTHWQPMAKG